LVCYKHIKSCAAAVQFSLLFIFVMMAVSVFLFSGCGGDEDKSAPAADISGIWNGSNSEGQDISFMFIQSSSGSISGTASFLGPISGRMSNRTLSIDGANLRGVLTNDNTTIRGSYTGTNGFAVNFAIAREGGPAPTVIETPSGGDDMPDDGDDGDDGDIPDGGDDGNGDDGDGDDGDDGPPMPPMP
jgi:hypothetical protein